MSRPARTVGVLAVQGAVGMHLAALARCGVDAVEVRTPAELDAVDAIVLPGGESTTISMMLEFNGLLEPMRARLAAGMPALGTCAGMITLATEILGGRADQHCLGAVDLSVRRNAFGRQVDSFETSLDITGLPGGPFPAVFIRAPVVERCGDDVEVLARLSDGEIVLCRQGSVVVAAFHPELSGDDRLHQLLVSLLEPSPAGTVMPGTGDVVCSG